MPQTKRNINLDLAKILACFAVVGLHTGIPGKMVYNFCGFAIPFFFMASGFMLFQKKEVQFAYVMRKVFQIVKLVIFWNIMFLIVQLICSIMKGDLQLVLQVRNLPLDIVKSFLHRGNMAHFWYFGALIFLYCFIWGIYAIGFDKLNDRFLALSRILGIVFVICLFFQITSYIFNKPVQRELYQTFRIWTWIFYAVLGGMMPRLIPKIKIGVKIHTGLFLALSIASVMYFQWIEKNVIKNGHVEFLYDSFVMMCWTAVFFSLIMRIRVHSCVQIRIKKLQPLTLGVYIVHWIIRSVVLSIISIPEGVGSLIWFIVLTVLSFLSVYILKKIPFVRTFLTM